MATTYQDTNVNQLVINKLTKQEYDNLPQVSENELWLIEEQVDSTVTQGSTNPVQSGAVYDAIQDNHEIIFCHMLSGEIFNETVIECTEVNGEIFDPQELIDRPNDPRPLFPDGNYYYATNTNKVYSGEVGDNEFIDVTASVMMSGDETKLYCDIDDNKLYRYDGTDFIMVGGGGVTSYNDLTEKPLSVVSNKVKYTLEDGTTQLTLAQESTIKDIPINFTDTLTNITSPFASGDDILTIVTKTWNIVKRLMQGYLCKDGNLQGGNLFMNFISYRETQYTYSQKELICKYWLSQVQARIEEIGCYDCSVTGILEMANKWYVQGSVDDNDVDQFCSFVAINTVHNGSSNITSIYFGYRNGTWNYYEKTI